MKGPLSLLLFTTAQLEVLVYGKDETYGIVDNDLQVDSLFSYSLPQSPHRHATRSSFPAFAVRENERSPAGYM